MIAVHRTPRSAENGNRYKVSVTFSKEGRFPPLDKLACSAFGSALMLGDHRFN